MAQQSRVFEQEVGANQFEIGAKQLGAKQLHRRLRFQALHPNSPRTSSSGGGVKLQGLQEQIAFSYAMVSFLTSSAKGSQYWEDVGFGATGLVEWIRVKTVSNFDNELPASRMVVMHDLWEDVSSCRRLDIHFIVSHNPSTDHVTITTPSPSKTVKQTCKLSNNRPGDGKCNERCATGDERCPYSLRS
jgi:hypothetical protein